MYEMAGRKHVKSDLEVGCDQVWEAQKERNGHVAMLIKIFKIGKMWDHTERIRETMLGGWMERN